jgi:hypothetical protein
MVTNTNTTIADGGGFSMSDLNMNELLELLEKAEKGLRKTYVDALDIPDYEKSISEISGATNGIWQIRDWRGRLARLSDKLSALNEEINSSGLINYNLMDDPNLHSVPNTHAVSNAHPVPSAHSAPNAHPVPNAQSAPVAHPVAVHNEPASEPSPVPGKAKPDNEVHPLQTQTPPNEPGSPAAPPTRDLAPPSSGRNVAPADPPVPEAGYRHNHVVETAVPIAEEREPYFGERDDSKSLRITRSKAKKPQPPDGGHKEATYEDISNDMQEISENKFRLFKKKQ